MEYYNIKMEKDMNILKKNIEIEKYVSFGKIIKEMGKEN